MRRAIPALCCLIAALGFAAPGCGSAETPKVTPVTVTLRVATDAAIEPLMRALTRAWSAQHPHVIFTLSPGSAPAVNEAIFSRRADLAAVTLLPETLAGRDALWVADLATDGIVVIVNPANPLTNVSMQQLRDIYAGALNRWDSLGAAGLGEIQTSVRETGDGARIVFDRVVMGNTRLTLNAVVLPSIDVVMNFVAYQAGAIGYVPSARITDTVSPPVKALAIDGQLPTNAALMDGSYPLSRSLYLIALSEPQAELRDFVAWILSAEGQRVVEMANYARLPGTP